MKKLILLIGIFICVKVNAQVIITQPYIFQKETQVTTAPVKATDVARLTDLPYADGVISGLGLSISGSNVLVASGVWRLSSILYSTSGTTTLPINAQDATLSRYDVIYGDNTNTLHVVDGTLSSSPVLPSIPGGTTMIGYVFITPTSVTTTPITPAGYVDLTTNQTAFGIKTWQNDQIDNGNITTNGNLTTNGNFTANGSNNTINNGEVINGQLSLDGAFSQTNGFDAGFGRDLSVTRNLTIGSTITASGVNAGAGSSGGLRFLSPGGSYNWFLSPIFGSPLSNFPLELKWRTNEILYADTLGGVYLLTTTSATPSLALGLDANNRIVKFTVPSGGGTTTNPLTLGYGILGTSFNGSAAVTAKADTSVLQTILNFFPKGDTRYGRLSQPLSQFASTTSAQLASTISDETGTGSAVFAGSPALTGTPTAPTATGGTNTTQLATTAFVQAAIPSLIGYVPYTGATSNLALGAHGISANLLTLAANASPTYAAGTIVYDSSQSGNSLFTAYGGDSNVSLQIGQEEWLFVSNATGSTIPNGTPVYVSGSSGGVPQVSPAIATASATAVCVGITTEAIATGTTGYVTTSGIVHNLDTHLFSTGAVYVGTTAGTLTQTAPTSPNYRYRVGFVTVVDASAGQIQITPSTGSIGNGTAGQILGINPTTLNQEFKTVTVNQGLTVSTATAGILQLGMANITPGTINTTHLPANIFQTPLGTAGTDSLVVKIGTTEKLGRISPTAYIQPSDTTTFAAGLVHKALVETITGAKTTTAQLTVSGGIATSSTLTTSNFGAAGGTAVATTTSSTALFGGSGSVVYRGLFNSSGAGGSSLTTGQSGGNLVIGSTPFTTPATGSIPVLANLVVNATGTITNGGVTPAIGASLYINGAGTGATTNAALYVASGTSIFGGNISSPSGTVLTFNTVGANSTRWQSAGTTYIQMFTNGHVVFQNGGTFTDNNYMSDIQSAGTAGYFRAGLFGVNSGSNFTFNGTAGTANQVPVSNGTTMSWVTPYSLSSNHTIFTPTTGGTVTLVTKQENIVNPSGTLATLILALPASPANNDVIYITFTQAITALTYSGGTVVGSPTSATLGGQWHLTYDSGTTTWY